VAAGYCNPICSDGIDRFVANTWQPMESRHGAPGAGRTGRDRHTGRYTDVGFGFGFGFGFGIRSPARLSPAGFPSVKPWLCFRKT